MVFSENQKEKAIALFKKDAQKRLQARTYMKEYREKRRENGIHQKSYQSSNNTTNVYNYYHRVNAILGLKYLFKE